MGQSALPDKLFFRIGEVAKIVGVRPHVLRYWETEFANLRPMKTRGAHRVYRRKDVELAIVLRRLLHEERYTIPGARKQLQELGLARTSSEPGPEVAEEVTMRAELLAVRQELSGLLSALDALTGDPVPGQPIRATVTRATPFADRRGDGRRPPPRTG
ncbi:MAG: MerR family transcriptional regulator, partial [Myxococcales bacterium]|nr:MerR family transcriptional regulator [Myxococcales bacterium]